MQYAGTGALKNDYTRHGNYYLNNWTDGFRQDAFDLFLGNAPARPLPKKQKLQYIVFPSLAVAFAGLVFLTSKTNLYSTNGLIVAGLWGSFYLLVKTVVSKLGPRLVNHPQLTSAK